MQRELLDKYANSNLRVYAVWFSMLASDAQSKWPSALLTDSRIVHRWDERKAVGRWYAQHTADMRRMLTQGSKWGDGEILWDSFVLYGRDASWQETPPGLIHWGRTIVAGREALKSDLEALFSKGK